MVSYAEAEAEADYIISLSSVLILIVMDNGLLLNHLTI